MVIKRRKILDHWDRIISSGRERCCICDKKVKDKSELIYFGLHKKTGQELYRHPACSPGEDAWNKKFGGYICPFLKFLNKKGK